jgi:hypothetical protein
MRMWDADPAPFVGALSGSPRTQQDLCIAD